MHDSGCPSSIPTEINPEQVPGLIPLSDEELDEVKSKGDDKSGVPNYENIYMMDARQAFDEKK